MAITDETINRICDLAQLDLDSAARLGADLERIIGMIDQLAELDAAAVAPLAHPLDLTQRLRDDVVTETDQRELFQALAPATADGLYLVPRVIE